MKTLTIHSWSIEPTQRALSCCGSLSAGIYYSGPWADLGDGLQGSANTTALKDIAQRLIETAVPEEGDIHPQRATAEIGPNWVRFTTPGGVSALLSATDGGITVDIDFGRDSVSLAAEMLAALAFGSSCTAQAEVIVDDIGAVNVYRALADASERLAQKFAAPSQVRLPRAVTAAPSGPASSVVVE